MLGYIYRQQGNLSPCNGRTDRLSTSLMQNIIDLIPVYSKKLTSEQYLKISDEERRNIDSCRFVPPTIGDRNFGFFSVKLKDPVYFVPNGQGK